MSYMVHVYYLPSTAPASTLTNATDHQTSERSTCQGDCQLSMASQTSECSVHQAVRGCQCSIVSQDSFPAPSAATADPTLALGPKIVVKQNGRNQVETFASWCLSERSSSRRDRVEIRERSNSLRRPQKLLSSGDEGEGFSGSDTASEAGNSLE